MSNRITADNMGATTPHEIADMPLEHLRMLAADLKIAKDILDAKRAVVATALHIRFGILADAARKRLNKDTGQVRLTLDNEPFEVAANLPKKVEWDSLKLNEIFDELTDEDAKHYCKAELSVPEKLFAGAPPHIKEKLAKARTVSTGTPTYDIIPKE